MDNKETDTGAFWGILIVIGLFLLYAVVMHDKVDNPRLKKGYDEIVAGDSTYIIHFTIDSAYENPPPDDDRDN